MPKNVVILSDGTGQVGGIAFDEDRTNIYKIYRSCRVAPDSAIDPAEQVAFYDPGLGSVADGGHMIGRMARWVYNKISQATGLGVTANIVDCYAALIRLWRPGDKIFLFGFSRGAYTARCLASVVGMCGIPQVDGDQKIRLDFASSQRIARRAVKTVYQFTHSVRPDRASPRELELMAQRTALAKRFREQYGSSDPADAEKANVYPHFIGVFDTVSAIASPTSVFLLTFAVFVLGLAVAGLIKLAFWLWPVLTTVSVLEWISSWGYLSLVVGLLGASAIVAAVIYLLKSVVWTTELAEYPWYRTIHLVQAKQRFRDFDLNGNVGYARHAISVDENRASFARVPWGFRDAKHAARDEKGNYWFQQLWFAGNHADIGGGYPENESRLSDIALGWMIDEAQKVGLNTDISVLRLHPSPDGVQHDEVAVGFGLVTRLTGKTWKVGRREIPNSRATLHPSVKKRFDSGDVQQYDVLKPYLPETLRFHDDVKHKYPAAAGPATAPAKTEDPNLPAPTQEQPN